LLHRIIHHVILHPLLKLEKFTNLCNIAYSKAIMATRLYKITISRLKLTAFEIKKNNVESNIMIFEIIN